MRFRSTDAPGPPLPPMIVDVESARRAGLRASSTFCGFCNKQIVRDDDWEKHACTDPAGRDLRPAKRAAAEHARQQLAALNRFPIPPCSICGRTDMRPGQSHSCSPRQTQLPHDAAANAFRRLDADEELLATLDRLGYEVHKKEV